MTRPHVLVLIVLLIFVAGIPVRAADAPAAAASPSTEDERHRGVEWQGAAAFVRLGSMTVVYPAGPGEPVEFNRRSAEARAQWLAGAHKNKVVVVADNEVTVEQRKGNLLILGWNNRLLGEAGFARPFTHDANGTAFLGIQEPDPTVGLLFYHRNPLNWSSFVLFWSRIEPELDRYQVIPRVGSDWAMYRDFRPIRQGMFIPAHAWPPQRDRQAEADHTGEGFGTSGTSASLDSPHFHVVFDRAAFNDDEIAGIVKAREAAFEKASASIASVPKDFRILLFLYADEQAKNDMSGVPDPSHSVPATREIHVIKRVAASSFPREEIHLVARAEFGPCYVTSIYEGLAFSFVEKIRGDDLETHAAMMRESGRLPSFDMLLDEERFRALPSEDAAIASGVFMTWLRQTYGAAGLKKVYGLKDARPAGLAAALSTTPDALTASFGSWADARVKAHKNDIDFLAAERDAQQKQIINDWKGMAAALQRALKAKPGDPQTLFNLASAQMRADDYAGAEASLKTMLAGPLGPDDIRFKVFGHYQLGRVYDLAGRRKDALSEYDAVLALPDDHGAHALALERKASPTTKEQLE